MLSQEESYKIRKLCKSITKELHRSLVEGFAHSIEAHNDKFDVLFFLDDFFKQYLEVIKKRLNK